MGVLLSNFEFYFGIYQSIGCVTKTRTLGDWRISRERFLGEKGDFYGQVT